MLMPTNTFKQAIASGKPQIGLWISLCSPFAAEVVASAGYDWVLLDMEHSPNELPTVLGQLQAFQQYGSTSIVRPPVNDPVPIKRLLDLGAPGLLLPMVQSVEEAVQAVASCRYPPNGIRGVSGMQRGNRFGRMNDYVQRVEQETCVILQLETRHALSLARDIASLEGVDGIFFGPADIAADFGLVGQPEAPQVWDAIYEAAQIVREAGKPVGTLVGNPQMAIELLNSGFSFVACGTDASLLARGADRLLQTVRDGIG
jgi:4-hydroxy-2-oxoheptanedioate aldolase